MRHALLTAAFLALAAVGGCAPAGPPYASVAASVPPVPAGMARIYVYRFLEPYESVAPVETYFNGKPVAVTPNGGVLYRDVAPGQYTVSVFSRGLYPNQFKTVVLRAGETAYARIDTLADWWPCGSGFGMDGAGVGGCEPTYVVTMVSPPAAQAEMQSLEYIRG